LVKISGCDLLLPTCTLPKLRLERLEARTPGAGAAVAVPARVTARFVLEASLTKPIFPLLVPAVVGSTKL